jgi:protein O-mannosyl-transferase
MANKKRNSPPSRPAVANQPVGNPRRAQWLAILGIVVATTAAYAISFRGAFFLDDYTLILDDRFEKPWPPWRLLSGPRPVVDLTLAANFAISGFEPWSYHAFNLTVHVLAALTLFGLVRRSIDRNRKDPRDATGTLVAAMATGLWALHPLNTQAVTYVIQRSESMMGLFYLLTLYALARFADSRRNIAWAVCAVAACALGMATKAVMVTAPVVALLFDRAVLSLDWREVWRLRWPVHLALAATWGVLGLLGVFSGVLETAPEARSTVGFGVATVTSFQYFLTQTGVILHYLRLAFWPRPLCLDYFDWPKLMSVGEAAPTLLAIVVLLIAALVACIFRPRLGFLAAAFFIILAPTSSVIPLQDMAFEHRMYLSLAALAVVITAPLLWPKWRKGYAAILLIAVATLGYATHQRNLQYADPIGMLRDVVTIRPNNARAHNNLAIALLDAADPDEAMEHFGRAIKIAPKNPKFHVNLADQLAKKGHFEDVAAHYRKAIELQPGLVNAHYNLANCLSKHLGRPDEAIVEYRETQKLDPSFLEAYIMLGNLFAVQGRDAEAIEEFRMAIAAAGPNTNPHTLAKAHFNLGNSIARNGRNDLALLEYQRALELNPQHYEAQYGIGYAHDRMEHPIEAVAAYRAALAMNPDYAPARQALEHHVGKEDSPPSAPAQR